MTDPHPYIPGQSANSATPDSASLEIDEAAANSIDLDRAEVRISLRCIECGYDIRGLKAAGNCPECSHDVLDTLHQSMDVAAAMPLMPNAPSIGKILFGLLLVATIATVIASIGSALAAASSMLGVGDTVPRVIMITGGIIACVGIIGATDLELRKMTGMVAALRTASNRFYIGYCTWSIALLVAGAIWTISSRGPGILSREARFMLLVSCAGGALAMSGIGPLIETLGTRCREFSASRHARQGAGGMMAALMLMAIGIGLTGFDKQETFGWVIVRITQLMLLIGMVYLTVNAWWIHKALSRPPLTLRQILRTTAGSSPGHIP